VKTHYWVGIGLALLALGFSIPALAIAIVLLAGGAP